MIFKEVLPALFAQTTLKEDPRWEEQFFYDGKSFEIVMELFRASLQKCNSNTDEELNLATAVCNDIIAFPARPTSSRLMADYLKFQVCTVIMNILAFKRLNHPLFHWIANSVSKSIKEDVLREFHGPWVLDFAESDLPYIKENLKIDFIQWTRQLFYYMRVMGGHQQLTAFYVDHLLERLFNLANRVFYYPDLDVALGQIVAWASNNRLETIKGKAAKIKMYLYDSLGYPEEWRKNIEFGFACTGYEYTGKTQKEWIALVMEKRLLNGHERLQLTAMKYQDNAKAVNDHLEEILSAIDEYHDYLRSAYTEDQFMNYELSRVYNLLTPVLLSLFQEGEVATANLIIGHYFYIKKDSLIEPENSAITQGTLKGVQYCRQNEVIWSGESPFEHAGKLMQTANTFFGWTGVMKDDISFFAEIPERGEGVPNMAYGPDLEALVVKFYGFDQQNILDFLSATSGYYLFSNYQLPLQPLMVKYGQFAIPMIQSFRKPLPARKIKKVFIWQGDSHSSEMECDAVQQLFKSAGIEVYRLNWHQSSSDEFLAAYRQDDFDLVWVSGHGEFNQFKPHLSSLVLYQDFSGGGRKNVTVNYDELRAYEGQSFGRRLLVLNICDGATTTLDNSPAAIGLGAKMLNESQSLISHQWPIEPFAGLINGFLLAKALAEGKDYMESYRYAVSTFLEGKQAVVTTAREVVPESELADVIDRNTAVDFRNLFFYGSLMYVE